MSAATKAEGSLELEAEILRGFVQRGSVLGRVRRGLCPATES
jgi:hypothetical protein